MQWLRDNLKMIRTSDEVESLAKTVDDNGGCYIVPAFSGLFAPYWKSNARGVFAGLTRYINAGHIARATLEATAFQSREVADAMNEDSGVPLESLRVDGGMVVNETLMQFQADILDVPVIRPQVAETTALGAAYAAGLATGFWASEDDLRQNWAEDKRWDPQMDESQRATSCTPTGRRRSPAPSTGSTDATRAARGPLARGSRAAGAILGAMVGIVVVSHSADVADGVVELAREMGGEEVRIEPAGGMADPPRGIGTDAELIKGAIERAAGDDGVLVLMDLGSALMSAEMAVEMAENAPRVVLSEAPLVEGAIAAAATARGGADLDAVATEARGALAPKAVQLGVEAADGDAAAPAAPMSSRTAARRCG